MEFIKSRICIVQGPKSDLSPLTCNTFSKAPVISYRDGGVGAGWGGGGVQNRQVKFYHYKNGGGGGGKGFSHAEFQRVGGTTSFEVVLT